MAEFNSTVAAQAAYADAPRVALNVIARAAAVLAVKGDNSGLYALFCNMAADGQTADAIRVVGAEVRSVVREELRERAGFTRVKLKGAKESKAPDYSTASVYAATVAGWLDAVATWSADVTQALADCQPEAGEIALHAAGMPAAQSTAARVLKRAGEIRAARTVHQHAALLRPAEQSEELDSQDHAATALATVRAENAQLRDEMARLQETIRAMSAQTA